MDEQTFDVYGDLEEFELQQVVKEKNDAHKKLEEKYDFAIKTIKNLQNDVKVWKKKFQNIEKSFWSLLETSKSEIKRKDSQLDTLRRQRDDVAFRRVKQNNKINDDTQKNLDYGNTISSSNINPFRSTTNESSNIEVFNNSQQEIEQQPDLRNRIINLKKAVNDECSKRKENSYYTNENKSNRVNKKDDEYKKNKNDEESITSEKHYSKDSHSHRGLNHHHGPEKEKYKDVNSEKRNYRDLGKIDHKNDTRNRKDSNSDSKYGNKNDSRKIINYRSPEKTYRKDDNRLKNCKDDNIKSYKNDKEYERQEKHNQQIQSKEGRESVTDTKDNNRDCKRICKLTENSKESIKLLVTIPNSTINDKNQKTSPIRTPIFDLTTNSSSAKKEIENTITKVQVASTSKTCEESVSPNNLISELMNDLRKLNNNNVTPAKKSTNTKSFEDVLFDNMVCGNEILSIVEPNSKSNKILDNSQKELILLQPYEISNTFTSDLNLTLNDTTMKIAKTNNQNLNTNDCEEDIFEESLHNLMKTKSQTYDKPIDLFFSNISSSSPIKLFGTNLKTPTKNILKHQSLELYNDNNLIRQNPLNKSATKFYELYLESPVKKIRDINEKNTIEVNDNIQIDKAEENLINNDKYDEKNTKNNQSNEKLINNQNDCNKNNNIANKGKAIKEILNTSNKSINAEINSEFTETISSNLIEHTDNNQKFNEIINNPSEQDETEISQKIKTNSEVDEVNDNSKTISNGENFNQNSDNMINPTSMSPNQKETIAATKYLTEMLQNNTPTKSSPSDSPLKMRMKLLFGNTPEPSYKIIPNHPITTCETEKNNDEILKNSNSIGNNIKEYFCKEIVEDNSRSLENSVNEVSALVEKNTEIIKKIEKNSKAMKNKRKAEISAESPSTKKLKIESTEKDLKSLAASQPENKSDEFLCILNDTKSSLQKDLKSLAASQPENKSDEFQCILNDTKSSLQEKKRTFLNSNKDSTKPKPELNSPVESKSADELVSKKLKESLLEPENEPGPDIFTVNITRKRRRIVNKNTQKTDIVTEQHQNSIPQQNMETSSTNNSKLINSEQSYSRENPKAPQTHPKTVEKRKECFANYKIPKLNKVTSKNNSVLPIRENFMKSFKIPKINKNSTLVVKKNDESNVIRESNQNKKEHPNILNKNTNEEIKLPYNENYNNSPNSSVENYKETSNISNLNKKFENEKCSTPKQQNNLSILPTVLSKNDEELFDCIFKSPLQVSGGGNNSPQIAVEQESIGGNSENMKFNQIEEDFRNLFGKSPQSKSSLQSPSIGAENENYSIQSTNNQKIEKNSNSETDLSSVNIKLHTEINKSDSENNINNSTSSTKESSILCKSFSTSSKEYQMMYDANEGIINWVITKKKIRKKKKIIT